jgi:Fur family ferric uptake transcriptional regulator
MNSTNEVRALKLLEQHKLRKTTMRVGVLNALLEDSDIALSNQEIESRIPDSDRVTLYRTLKTFEKSGLIHQAMDGSGSNKYALCHEECSSHEHLDNHAHFHCVLCERTICLDEIETPHVNVPQGYTIQESYLVIKGTCESCQ